MPQRDLKNLTELELAALFNAVADAVKQLLPPGTLFAVIAFDDPGVGQYVSNAQRGDMIRALRETADRLERREDIERTA
jgi:hypothetical protein